MRILLLTVVLCAWGVAQQKRTTEMERAVEEFKIQTRTLGAGSPQPGGTALKPLWHGRIFENFRNDALDAVPHEGGTLSDFAIGPALPSLPWHPGAIRYI